MIALGAFTLLFLLLWQLERVKVMDLLEYIPIEHANHDEMVNIYRDIADNAIEKYNAGIKQITILESKLLHAQFSCYGSTCKQMIKQGKEQWFKGCPYCEKCFPKKREADKPPIEHGENARGLT
jgi:hypothetical protein